MFLLHEIHFETLEKTRCYECYKKWNNETLFWFHEDKNGITTVLTNEEFKNSSLRCSARRFLPDD
jgi:hypothetical protein